MKIINEWTDDHLPCISFEHGGNKFEINWTDTTLVGKLQLVEDGDVTLERALKKYPSVLNIIQNPYDCVFASPEEGERVEEEEEGAATYETDFGFITVRPFTE